MCGIFGAYNIRSTELQPGLIFSPEKEASLMRHRGPDDFGYFSGPEIFLGHNRLSIIDLNTGKQPIFNEDKSICIIFNGEIYNFATLRKHLENRGHSFHTNSDTEAIIHAYA